VREAGCTGSVVVRADSAYYGGAFIAACRRARAHFSITVRADPKVKAAIASIQEAAWVAIRYPDAIYDEASATWVSDAEVAEVGYTAFASSPAHAVTGRLIVRRVKRLNPKAAAGQGELLPDYRYHALFTDSPFQMLTAEAQHRGHAVIELAVADLIDGPPTYPQGPSQRTRPGCSWPRSHTP
jgi:hypothetical protein